MPDSCNQTLYLIKQFSPSYPEETSKGTSYPVVCLVFRLGTQGDKRFARQYRFEPPPTFPITLPISNIIHRRSGPDTSTLDQTIHNNFTPTLQALKVHLPNHTDTDMNASVMRQSHQAKLVQLNSTPACSSTSELSFGSPLHLAFMILVRYQSRTHIELEMKFTIHFTLHPQGT